MRLRITCGLAALLAGAAHAALFDDEEARRPDLPAEKPGRGAPEGDRGASVGDRRAARAAGFVRQNRVVDLAQLIESLKQTRKAAAG